MLVTLNTFRSYLYPFQPAINYITELFNRLVNTITGCWGSRKAKPVEVPTKTDLKADKIFHNSVSKPVESPAKSKPIETPASLTESRFKAALWDKANGLSKADHLPLINETSLSDEDKNELRLLIEKNDREQTISFLRKRDNFDTYLYYIRALLTKIRTSSATREELKLEIREIRKYFINRSTWFAKNSGHDSGGLVEHFTNEFLEPLFNMASKFGDNYVVVNDQLINSNYTNRGKNKESGWVAGFTFQEGGHAIAFVRTKNGFIKFDNLQKEGTLYSVQEIHNLLTGREMDVLKLVRFPLNEKLDRIPDTGSWVMPTWERNNCFIAASLMYLAICQHYADNS